MLTEAQRDKEVTEDKLIEYTDTMVSDGRIKTSSNLPVVIDRVIFYSRLQLQVFDSNRDGKLQLSEMSKYELFLFSFLGILVEMNSLDERK